MLSCGTKNFERIVLGANVWMKTEEKNQNKQSKKRNGDECDANATIGYCGLLCASMSVCVRECDLLWLATHYRFLYNV